MYFSKGCLDFLKNIYYMIYLCLHKYIAVFIYKFINYCRNNMFIENTSRKITFPLMFMNSFKLLNSYFYFTANICKFIMCILFFIILDVKLNNFHIMHWFYVAFNFTLTFIVNIFVEMTLTFNVYVIFEI